MSEARAIQDKISYEKEYHRVVDATDSDEMAHSAAADKVALEQRDRAGQFGRLINARSGAADISQAAGLAIQQTGGPEWTRTMDAMHQTLKQQHQEAMAESRAEFTPQ